MPAFRPDAVILHPDVEAAYDALEADAARGEEPQKAVWKSFRTALERIRVDAQWGEVIPKRSIPRHFRKAYGLHNLYCVDLAGFRRCFYTIEGRSVILLDLVDHAQYDKWFPNRGK